MALTMRKMTKATRMKSMTVLRNVPRPSVTGSFTTVSPSMTAAFSVRFSWPRSTPPMSRPMRGMNTSFTRDVVILPKRRADDDTDGHVHHVAPHGKFSELIQKLFHGRKLLYREYII